METLVKPTRGQVIKARYGKDFYRIIGAKGAAMRQTIGGFASPKIGADGMTGPQRAKHYQKLYPRNAKGSKWSAQHRANFNAAIARRNNPIGIDVDLSNVELHPQQTFWYLSP